jgi:hypothetical protein
MRSQLSITVARSRNRLRHIADENSKSGPGHVVPLAICFEPVPVSRLLGTIPTECHAAPTPRSTAGVIREEERARRSLACLDVGEIL